MKRYERLTEELLKSVVPTCLSYVEVCRQLGKAPVGGNTTHVKNMCIKYGIDCSHMTGRLHSKGKPSAVKRTADGRLVIGLSTDIRTKPSSLKRCLIERGVEYKCNECDIVDWNGKPLVLEIDHINSKYWDNRQENLQFICPCCHSQVTKERGRLV